jgi:two-component system, sensor histidine kinase and response regulator
MVADRDSERIEPTAEREVAVTDRSRILVVDDIDENLVALEALLRRDDADIITARSGTEALELILQHEFALAFIDVQMPEMDGFELAELMRGAERSKYIPIIFLTAGAREAQRVFRGYESGAVDFLFKPVDPNILRHKTNTFIGLDQQRKKLAEQFQQLQRSEALLREAVQAREDVLAVVSHDIRNFLQAIKSGVHLLSKSQDKMSADARAAIQARIASTVDLMGRMIADLLDMASIRTGRIEVMMRPEIAGQLASEAVAVHEPLAQHKGIRLAAQCEVPTEVVVCDRERILQVLANLLGNAVKFCRHGDQIQVRVRRVEGQVQVSVVDTGPGIAPADLPMVFDAYWSGANDRRTGTGLGLYITKRIIEAHGGRIWIDSEPGQGTTVHFTLDVATAAPAVTS